MVFTTFLKEKHDEYINELREGVVLIWVSPLSLTRTMTGNIMMYITKA
jgi:hypothetical protein